jgi:hypothetical protein
VVPVFTVTKFLGGEGLASSEGFTDAYTCLFLSYLFCNFVNDDGGSHRGVADSGLVEYDSIFELVQFAILHSIVSQKT